MNHIMHTRVHFADGDGLDLSGTGYAVRCAACIADHNVPDALWALRVLNTYGHLVPHAADGLGVARPVPDEDAGERRAA